MKKAKIYSLCEAVADITYTAANENYTTEDSREMISNLLNGRMNLNTCISTLSGVSTHH